MPEVTYRLEIRGRVQGVFYRSSMIEVAQRVGVRGWVRNRLDGSVEAVVAGEPDLVDLLIKWTRQGPEPAVVTSVDVYPGEYRLDYFVQRETV
jgi:acylphosphatase